MLGRDAAIFRPGIFAVGGGMNPVLPPLEAFGSPLLELGLRGVAPPAFDLEGVPPYFSRSSCVVLYLVAVLSLSIVFSLCFCNESKCA